MPAYLRNDEEALASNYDDAQSDTVPFIVGLASQSKMLADKTGQLSLWKEFLHTTVAVSTDRAVDPKVHERLARDPS